MKKLLPFALLAVVVRIMAGIFSEGFHHKDELFQVLEPAYGLLHGEWFRTWEWERGIRSWFLPGTYAGLMAAFEAVGLRDSGALAVALRICSGLLSLLSVWGVYVIGLRFFDRKVALASATFVAFWPTLIYFSVRTLSEPLSASLFIVSAALCLYPSSGKKGPTDRDSLIAGVLAAVSFGVRFQCGVLISSLALVLATQKRWRSAIIFSAATLTGIFALGLLDLFTWGSFLHSAVEYLRFNVIEGGAARDFGTDPWHRYITTLVRFFTFPVAILMLVFSISALVSKERVKKTWPLWALIIPFVAVHQIITHREPRFIIPVLPYFILIVVATATNLLRRHQRIQSSLAALVGVCALVCAITYPWLQHAEMTRTLTWISRQPDLTGAAVAGRWSLESGGRFYLYRQIAFVTETDPARIDPKQFPFPINYLVIKTESTNLIKELKDQGVRCQAAAYPDVLHCRKD